MRTEHDSREILDRALEAAHAHEADAVFIATDQNISRFANSSVHQNMSEESAGLTLRVIVDGRMGVASTSSFDAAEIATTAALAHEAARHADPLTNFSGLYHDHEEPLDLRTFDEATATVTPMEKALALRAMFDRGRGQNVEFAGSFATAATSVATANTHGVRRFARMTMSEASVIALHGGGSGFATDCSRHIRDIDIAALGEQATTRALLSGDRLEQIEPGPYDVILEPSAMGEVLDWLNMIAFTGQAYEDGSSFLVGNVGRRILGQNITIADDATDEQFLPFPFDAEGLPKRRVALVEGGIIRTPVVDKVYADRLSLPPTANGWDLGSPDHGTALHLAIAGGDATREELIASTKRGILVTRFNYVNGLLEPRTALMTGTTRDGTFLIRDGKVAARLPNLRWTQSITEALSNVEALTRERRRIGTWHNSFGGSLVPIMKIRGWKFDGAAS
ncbi:MAG: metallopeptidase TldD-related protein [Acidobacteriota bacterium]